MMCNCDKRFFHTANETNLIYRFSLFTYDINAETLIHQHIICSVNIIAM